MRVLLTCRPLVGHYHPLLPLARALGAAGHDVALATGEPIATEAERSGLTVFRAGLDGHSRDLIRDKLGDVSTLTPLEVRIVFFRELFVRLEVPPRATALDRVVAGWRPDLIVHEVGELAGPLVAAAHGLSSASHAFGVVLPDEVAHAAGAAAAPLWSERGLEPDARAGLYRGLYLDVCPPGLQGPEVADLDAVQPIRSVERVDSPAAPWLEALRDRPVVYVTLGTVFDDTTAFETLLEGVAAEPVHVIVTVGPRNDPAALGPQPANVHVHGYVPQAELLPHCAAVVAHGGSGTLLGALAHGLPLLLVPQGADHFTNAERVVAAGAGIQLSSRRPEGSLVQAGLRRLLDDDAYARSARRIAFELAAMPAPSEAVAALERLAAQSRSV